MSRQNIVCFGDSITHALRLAENDRWTARLAAWLDQEHPDTFAVYNRGYDGNTTALGLDRLNADVLPLLPATVLIEFGVNDGYVYPWCRKPRVGLSDYVGNLDEIANVLRSRDGRPVVIINHPVGTASKLHPQGNGKSLQQNLVSYATAARQLAARKKIPCIDLPRIIRNARIDPSMLLTEDEVHLSITGNRIYASLIASSLQRVVPDLGPR